MSAKRRRLAGFDFSKALPAAGDPPTARSVLARLNRRLRRLKGEVGSVCIVEYRREILRATASGLRIAVVSLATLEREIAIRKQKREEVSSRLEMTLVDCDLVLDCFIAMGKERAEVSHRVNQLYKILNILTRGLEDDSDTLSARIGVVDELPTPPPRLTQIVFYPTRIQAVPKPCVHSAVQEKDLLGFLSSILKT